MHGWQPFVFATAHKSDLPKLKSGNGINGSEKRAAKGVEKVEIPNMLYEVMNKLWNILFKELNFGNLTSL